MRSVVRAFRKWAIRVVALGVAIFAALAAIASFAPEPTPEEIAARAERERIATAQAEVDAAADRRARFKLDAEIFCARQIASRMKDPEFSAIGENPSSRANPDGGYSFAWDDLTSRNGFGMDVKVTADCTVDGSGELRGLVINGRDAL